MQKQFKYKAIDINKKKFSGIFIAQDEDDLTIQLRKQGLFLVSAKLYNSNSPNSFFSLGTGGVKQSELTNFCVQFSIMLNTGISILDCLDILKEQKFSTYFKRVISIAYEDIKAGYMLSQAFDKHKQVFPDFMRSMVKVGELSGKLDYVFNSIATYYEKNTQIKRKTKSALIYPAFLFVMMIGIVVLMVAYIVPTFRNSLSSMDVEITGLTQTVYDLSDFFLLHWKDILLWIVGIGFMAVMFGFTKVGKEFYDKVKLELPGISGIEISLVTSRFARAFGVLISSGMDVSSALESVKIVLGNKIVEKKMVKATEDIRLGVTMAAAFSNYKIFPIMLIQMVAVGERTATLGEILDKSSSYFDEQVESALNSVVGILQPVLLAVIGGVVGLMFIAVYSPILSMISGIM